MALPAGRCFPHWEEQFRVAERAQVKKALAGSGVVSVGGGAVTTEETRELFADHTVVVGCVGRGGVFSH